MTDRESDRTLVDFNDGAKGDIDLDAEILAGGPGMPQELPRAAKPAEVVLANPEAEAAVLGAILGDEAALAEVTGILTPASFFYAPNRIIFAALRDLATDVTGSKLDHVTLRNYLVAREQLDEVGGLVYLADLIDVVYSSANIGAHAAIVADLKARRDVLSVLDATRAATVSRKLDLAPTLASAVDGLMQAAPVDVNAAEPLASTLWKCMEEIDRRLKGGERVIGLSSGVDTLDHVTLGFKPAELIVVAARPSMGKTAFLVNVARHIAGDAERLVALFSIEMPKRKIVSRMIAAEAIVDLPEMYAKPLAADLAYTRLAAAAGRVAKWPVLIDDRADVTAAQIRFQVDRWTRDLGERPALVGVDYLGLMGDRDPQSYERSDQRIGARVKDLRNLICKALDIPLVLVVQLSRESVKGEKPRRPRLSDLRDSGEIEQHADVVIFVHPTGADGGHDPSGLVEMIVAKNRDGPTGTAEAKFRRETGRFSSWRRDQRGIE